MLLNAAPLETPPCVSQTMLARTVGERHPTQVDVVTQTVINGSVKTSTLVYASESRPLTSRGNVEGA
jgi:hypothetical protein